MTVPTITIFTYLETEWRSPENKAFPFVSTIGHCFWKGLYVDLIGLVSLGSIQGSSHSSELLIAMCKNVLVIYVCEHGLIEHNHIL